MKRCADCGRIKPLDEFYFIPSRRDGKGGHDTYCKPCRSAYSARYAREMRQFPRYRAQAAAASRRYYARHHGQEEP